MHRLLIALVFVSGAASAKSWMDDKLTVTHDCAKDPVASIMGNENHITLTGACAKVSVQGNKNTVTVASAKEVLVAGNDNTVDIDAADSVSTPGNKNTVSWKKGVSDKKPAIRNAGTDNKISQK
jgi:hypothetical protein